MSEKGGKKGRKVEWSLEVTCQLKGGWAYSDVKPWAEITQRTDDRYLKFGTQLPFVLVCLPFFQLRYVGCARVQSERAHAVLVRTEGEKRRVISLCSE